MVSEKSRDNVTQTGGKVMDLGRFRTTEALQDRLEKLPAAVTEVKFAFEMPSYTKEKAFYYAPREATTLSRHFNRNADGTITAGGWYNKDGAYVDKTAHLDPGVVVLDQGMVLDRAWLGDRSRVECFGIVGDSCRLFGTTRVAGAGAVYGNTVIRNDTVVNMDTNGVDTVFDSSDSVLHYALASSVERTRLGRALNELLRKRVAEEGA